MNCASEVIDWAYTLDGGLEEIIDGQLAQFVFTA